MMPGSTGTQRDSQKHSYSSWKFGTSTRNDMAKVFVSSAHAKSVAEFIDSPGPCAYGHKGGLGQQTDSRKKSNESFVRRAAAPSCRPAARARLPDRTRRRADPIPPYPSPPCRAWALRTAFSTRTARPLSATAAPARAPTRCARRRGGRSPRTNPRTQSRPSRGRTATARRRSLPRPPHGSSIPCRGWADGVSTGRLWGAGEICAKSTLIWVFLVWQTGSRRTSGKSGGHECSE